MNWFTIRAKAEQRAAEVWIYGDIGESWSSETVTAKQFVEALAKVEAERITVRINSIGGSVPDGLAIYNAIKRHPAAVTVSIDGMALSIASLIAMAGDEVVMAENALLMIHAPWSYAYGNSADMREMADVLDKWAEAMSSSYCAKCGMSRDDVLALLTDGNDHYYTADEAVSAGFADSVSEALPIAAAASVPQAALDRYKTRAAQSSAAPAAPSHVRPSMPEPTAAGGAPQPATDPKQVLAADKERRDAIRAQFKQFLARDGVSALLDTCLDDHDVTPVLAGTRLLAKLGEGATPVAGTHVVTLEDETDKRKASVTAALLVRAGLADAKLREAAMASEYRGMKLLDLARASLDRGGVSYKGRAQMDIVAMAFTQSTSDFPVLLESAMHKALQQAYATAPDTWSRFCARGSVSDFRAHNRYRVGSIGNLDSLNELGEFENKTIPDGEKSSVTIGTKGNIINMSRQIVINDDLGAFLGAAAMLGRAGRRTIEAAVYALLGENSGLGPTMSDGLSLFHATHGNIGTGAAISVVALDSDRQKMASQLDVGGNDYLDLRPSVLLVPLASGGTARVLNGAEYDPDTANKLQRPNIVRGLFNDVVDTPRLAGTRYYMFADPESAPVIEVAFLDGVEEPYLEQEVGFTVDGTRYKVRLDFGVAGIDFRGGVTNAGTA